MPSRRVPYGGVRVYSCNNQMETQKMHHDLVYQKVNFLSSYHCLQYINGSKVENTVPLNPDLVKYVQHSLCHPPIRFLGSNPMWMSSMLITITMTITMTMLFGFFGFSATNAGRRTGSGSAEVSLATWR